jgi:hypothetical protein
MFQDEQTVTQPITLPAPKRRYCFKPRRRIAKPRPEPTVWFSCRPGTYTQCANCGVTLIVSSTGRLRCECCGYGARRP